VLHFRPIRWERKVHHLEITTGELLPDQEFLGRTPEDLPKVHPPLTARGELLAHCSVLTLLIRHSMGLMKEGR
jgi:hypothetical protein